MFFNFGHWLRGVFALSIGFSVIVLGHYIVDDPEMVRGMARGLATPLTWPTWMLGCMGLCAIGWAIEEGWKAFHLSQEPSAQEEALEFGDVGFEKEAAAPPLLPIVLGLALALAYAFAIPWLGFTVSTVVFLLAWFLIGGVRKPGQLLGVTLIGTAILLYVFVKLALMPLDKGAGAFGEFTISLFRLMGIY
jgi:putative tricarboxylic transport membrane protein